MVKCEISVVETNADSRISAWNYHELWVGTHKEGGWNTHILYTGIVESLNIMRKTTVK